MTGGRQGTTTACVAVGVLAPQALNALTEKPYAPGGAGAVKLLAANGNVPVNAPVTLSR